MDAWNGGVNTNIALAATLLLDTGRLPHLATGKEAETAESEDRRYFCAACGEAITSPAERTVRADSFEHVFANPVGDVYRIGCFRKAPGCLARGEPTDFFTWFPGYAWSFALCRACVAHLGWRFTGRGDDFFGLILDNLKDT